MKSKNPFLDNSFEIRWNELTPENIENDISLALESASLAIENLENLPLAERSYETTFVALEKATSIISIPWQKVLHLDGLCNSKVLREAIKAMLPKVSGFFASIPLNPKLYEVLRSVKERIDYGNLSELQKRFIEETLLDFEESGGSLPDSNRTRLAEIESRLADITKSFSDNVLDSTNDWELVVDDVESLKGLPDSFIEAAKFDALQKGYGSSDEPKYRFTLHLPSLQPALRFLDSNDLRKKLYEANARVGHYGDFENEDIIVEILKLRHEKAELLGKSQFSDLILQRRMAKTGAKAIEFVDELDNQTKPAFDKENKELADFRAKTLQTTARDLYPWENAYWAEKLRREKFDFDEEELRPYFPVDSVLSGLFKLTEKLFSVRVCKRIENKPQVWHDSVEYFDLFDLSTNAHLGSFYTDWFPRESKRSGAWMSPMLTGKHLSDTEREPHLGLIAGNFNKPVGDRPALLTHREVETVFHEFGHLIHHLLSMVSIKSLSGTNVAWDFVELPSQIMENWCWERESLDLFARHFKTSEPIPDVLFNKMLKARTFGAARAQMRQLSFAKMDLALHQASDRLTKEILDEFIDQVLEGYKIPTPVKTISNIRSFLHLFSDSVGYASGYYSYKWAEVLDADAFTRFQEKGIMDPAIGMEFRLKILSKGNSFPPEQLFKDFMNREPDPRALLRRLGLLV